MRIPSRMTVVPAISTHSRRALTPKERDRVRSLPARQFEPRVEDLIDQQAREHREQGEFQPEIEDLERHDRGRGYRGNQSVQLGSHSPGFLQSDFRLLNTGRLATTPRDATLR
jgi:hypothetical protein